LKRLADGFNGGNARFRTAARGDTLIALALRKSAFHCAATMMKQCTDPLRPNELGEDLFKVLELQYGVLAEDIRNLQVEREDAGKRVLIPSEAQALKGKEDKIIDNLNKMIVFIDSSLRYLEQRQVDIEKDIWFKKRADLRREEISFEKRWNISLYDKVQTYVKVMNVE
jgi:hypothetical protein